MRRCSGCVGGLGLLCSATQPDGSCFTSLRNFPMISTASKSASITVVGGRDERDRRLQLANEEIHGRDLRNQKPGRNRHGHQQFVPDAHRINTFEPSPRIVFH